MPNFFAAAKIHLIRSPVNPHLLGFQLYPLGPVFIVVAEGVGRADVGSRAAQVEADHAGTSSAERRVSSNRLFCISSLMFLVFSFLMGLKILTIYDFS